MNELSHIVDMVMAMPIAKTMGLRFVHCRIGDVVIELPNVIGLTYSPGKLQATAIFAVADFASVAAAATRLEAGQVNATIDATLKIFSPAEGELLRAKGRIISDSRLLTICAADVYSIMGSKETLCATMIGTARKVNR